MDVVGNRLRRAFDLRPLPPRKKPSSANNRNTISRRAASLDALGDWRHPQQAVSESMFGRMIGDDMDETTGINKFVQWCIEAIETTGEGLKTDSIYRVTAGQVGAKRISWQAERSMPRVLERETNVHVLTAGLKLFFKSLKQPIMRMEDFQAALQPHLNDKEIAALLRQVVHSLPLAERNTLAYLFQHLKRVVDTKENNMTLATLSASFGPTLMRLRAEFVAQASMAKDMKQQNRLVGQLLLYSDVIYGAASTHHGEGELDTSPTSSDDEESISSLTKKTVLVASADNHNMRSSSENKERICEDNIESSTSSDDSEAGSSMKQRVLVASADNYKRNSSLSANKQNAFREKVSSSSSNDMKTDTVLVRSAGNKIKPPLSESKGVLRNKVSSSSSNDTKTDSVLVASAGHNTKPPLSQNQVVFREMVSSASSNDVKTDSSIKEQMMLAASAVTKRNSLRLSKKESMFTDKIEESSSEEDKPKAPIKKHLLLASTDDKRNSLLLENKARVSRDKIDSTPEKNQSQAPIKNQVFLASTDSKISSLQLSNKEIASRDKIDSSPEKNKSKVPIMKRLVAASNVFKRNSYVTESKTSVSPDQMDRPSLNDEAVRDPSSNQNELSASANDYEGNSSFPNNDFDITFRDTIDVSSSDEMELHPTKKVKQASAARTAIKKMRNKLFPFRTAKNKRKSSLSSDDEMKQPNETRRIKQLNVSEIDAMSVKIGKHTEQAPELKADVVVPPTMLTFKSSNEHLDSKHKLQHQTGQAGAVKKVVASSTGNKNPKSLLTFKLISSSSSSESDNDTYSTRAKIDINEKINGESTNSNNVKPCTQTDTPLKRPTDNAPDTKSNIPPSEIQRETPSSDGEMMSTSGGKIQRPIAYEVIDIKESVAKVNTNKASDIVNGSSLNATLKNPNGAGYKVERETVYTEKISNERGRLDDQGLPSSYLHKPVTLLTKDPKKTFLQSLQHTETHVPKEYLVSMEHVGSTLNQTSKNTQQRISYSSSSSENSFVKDSLDNLVGASCLENVPTLNKGTTAMDSIHKVSSKSEHNSKTISHSSESYGVDHVVVSKDMKADTNDSVEYATVHKINPSVAMAPPDIFKPTPTLTEVFNSNTIQSIQYAPPLDSSHQTNNSILSSINPNTLDSTFKKRASTSSSSEESFSDSSDDYMPLGPPPPPPSTDSVGITIQANIPTVL